MLVYQVENYNYQQSRKEEKNEQHQVKSIYVIWVWLGGFSFS
jgi:hypothetical protein